MLLRARDLFLRGDYEDAVGVCRTALESLAKGWNEEEAEKTALKVFRSRERDDIEALKGMKKEERHLLLRNVIRQFTHLAHHAPDDPTIVIGERMTRSDATLIQLRLLSSRTLSRRVLGRNNVLCCLSCHVMRLSSVERSWGFLEQLTGDRLIAALQEVLGEASKG